MSEKIKRWEDEQSMRGAGIVQGILGIPFGSFTNGILELQQRQRIVDGVEKIATVIEDEQHRIVAKLTDGTEVLERMHTDITHGLEGYFENMSEHAGVQEDLMLNMDVNLDSIRETGEEIAEGIDRLNVTSGMAVAGLAYLGTKAERIEKGIQGVNEGLEDVNENLSGIGSALEAIDKELGKIDDTLQEGFEETNTNLSNIHETLEELSGLAVSYIAEHKITRETIRKALGDILAFIELAGRNLIAETRKLLYASLATIKAVDRVGDVALGIKEEIAKGTRVQIQLADTSEARKAAQYKQQGRLLFEKGFYRESLECFVKAYDFSRADYETNLYLANIHCISGKREVAERHYVLAEGLAETVPEKSQLAESLMRFGVMEKDKGIVIGNAQKLLALSPAVYYSPVFAKMTKGIDAEEEILFPLVRGQNCDSDVLALCAVELSKLPGFQTGNRWENFSQTEQIESVFERLVGLAGQKDGNPVLFQKVVEACRGNTAFKTTLSKYILLNLDKIPVSGLLRWATIFLMGEEKSGTARMVVMQSIEKDPRITSMRKQGDYKGIVTLLRSEMGDEAGKLRLFGELPREIRDLLR